MPKRVSTSLMIRVRFIKNSQNRKITIIMEMGRWCSYPIEVTRFMGRLESV
jgi:hypothetical protein